MDCFRLFNNTVNIAINLKLNNRAGQFSMNVPVSSSLQSQAAIQSTIARRILTDKLLNKQQDFQQAQIVDLCCLNFVQELPWKRKNDMKAIFAGFDSTVSCPGFFPVPIFLSALPRPNGWKKSGMERNCIAFPLQDPQMPYCRKSLP